MSHITSEKIPNNVDLSGDRKLQRALEEWQPRFIEWWKEMGPEGFQEDQVYSEPRSASKPMAGPTSIT